MYEHIVELKDYKSGDRSTLLFATAVGTTEAAIVRVRRECQHLKGYAIESVETKRLIRVRVA